MRNIPDTFCTVTLLIVLLRLANTTPTCPTRLVSNNVQIDGQEKFNQTISQLIAAPYDHSKCVVLNVIAIGENYYKINLVELLKIKNNFVISGVGQQVRLDCTGSSNGTTANPLSGLQYVGFYQLSFYDCSIPLWVENVTTIDMEEVTFR